MKCCPLNPHVWKSFQANETNKQTNKNSSKINPVNRNLWEETYGTVSCKTEGGRMVKPQLLLSLQGTPEQPDPLRSHIKKKGEKRYISI